MCLICGRRNKKTNLLNCNWKISILKININFFTFSGISAEAAAWLANSNKFVGVGVDTASVDPGISKTSDAHRILCGKGLYLVESAKLLEDLPGMYQQ